MGSQNAKPESNQTNSFIQGEDLERTDSLNLDASSKESSLGSSLIDTSAMNSDPNKTSVTFKWNFGGNEVFVIGSFNGWRERLRMEKADGEFQLEVLLEKGVTHEYKFIVDNEWRFAPDQPTKKDEHGNINNWIDTSTFEENKKTFEEAKLADTYTQELCADLTTMEPDPLPLHLHYVLTNHSNSYDYRQKQTIPFNSPIKQTNAELAGENNLPSNELPIPPHVILNHLGVRANERVIGLTTTQRYRDKFVTTVYYKPIK
mgnify:CR=1 FL=1